MYVFRGGKIGGGAGSFPSYFVFPILIIIPPLLHTHLSPPPEFCDSRDQTAAQHPTLSFEVKHCSNLTEHVGILLSEKHGNGI